ncbi:AraC family transcriptional regulator [Paralimibaculum aggregatum]|uniref:AraC family transcriptional regulator n=1 Tax=Paralimibaculum aggregatum TaxID=3036245 RepID=A0ABQ6LJ70_9RHOB|nr:AraC family transcriptional regulator [Limibaculum sp. NKW23]GMG83325.1 AraC family transcriptional regulator [Limibaculum sp. NKW23]
MQIVARALWFIETNRCRPLTLADIARDAGVSRHHLARSFQRATGRPVMGYLRGRRLAEAARMVAGGSARLIEVALENGYGSHEAFTRAFRQEFGVPPEAVRAARSTASLSMQERIAMPNDTAPTNLPEPRMVEAGPIHLAGLEGRYTAATRATIPALWQRFGEVVDEIPGRSGAEVYGLCRDFDGEGGFGYMAAVAVTDPGAVPPDFATARLATARYAVFEHRGQVTEIHRSFRAIFGTWLPRSGFAAAGPEFERYDDRFDPGTGTGLVEIWVPVTPKSG